MDAAAPELAALRAKLADLEAQVDELRVALDAATGSRGGARTPPRPQPAWDEVEVDSRVLDGSTPSGGSQRREDKSLEWAASEIAVLRLYGWSGPATIAYPVLQDDEESSGTTAALDGIHFLVRVPVDPSDPSKGSALKYAKLGRVQTDSCEESSSSSSSSSA